ncbi:hypothetical protein EGR_10434 [Echinococcus granulosus]|uniref:Uncharacterized protein n=1 Tax=Echinococcus granulosus TaxID=6210 RepID=W6U0S0_ECHGR|nr:hypothetical protein EGR_10434 [Echinococcus granulosus]EUB54715.1 hypothetical protein EGR_10434 [Echinococcus granulosus]
MWYFKYGNRPKASAFTGNGISALSSAVESGISNNIPTETVTHGNGIVCAFLELSIRRNDRQRVLMLPGTFTTVSGDYFIHICAFHWVDTKVNCFKKR